MYRDNKFLQHCMSLSINIQTNIKLLSLSNLEKTINWEICFLIIWVLLRCDQLRYVPHKFGVEMHLGCGNFCTILILINWKGNLRAPEPNDEITPIYYYYYVFSRPPGDPGPQATPQKWLNPCDVCNISLNPCHSHSHTRTTTSKRKKHVYAAVDCLNVFERWHTRELDCILLRKVLCLTLNSKLFGETD